jgi:hypothetical protein
MDESPSTASCFFYRESWCATCSYTSFAIPWCIIIRVVSGRWSAGTNPRPTPCAAGCATGGDRYPFGHNGSEPRGRVLPCRDCRAMPHLVWTRRHVDRMRRTDLFSVGPIGVDGEEIGATRHKGATMYDEETPKSFRHWRRWSMHRMRATDMHRIVWTRPDTLTLVLAGPVVRSCGFHTEGLGAFASTTRLRSPCPGRDLAPRERGFFWRPQYHLLARSRAVDL